MDKPEEITAPMTRGDDPNWSPLQKVLDEEGVGEFMWMYAAETPEGQELHAYKHHMTRRYVFLDLHGNAFQYAGEARYRRMPLIDLVDAALGRPRWSSQFNEVGQGWP